MSGIIMEILGLMLLGAVIYVLIRSAVYIKKTYEEVHQMYTEMHPEPSENETVQEENQEKPENTDGADL